MLTIMAGVLLLGQADEKPVDWPTILKDAQVTNRSLFKSGHVAGRLTYIVRDQGEAQVEFTIDWVENRSLIRFRGFDPKGIFFSREIKSNPADRQFSHKIVGEKTIIYHNADTALLQIYPQGGSQVDRLAELTPWENWFRCCPPHSASGRLWVDLIGRIPNRNTKDHVFEYEKQENGVILQTRNDPGVGTVKTWFSANDDLNVIKVETSFLHPQNSRSVKGTYAWTRRNRVSVPTAIDFVESRPGAPDSVETEYHLTFSDVRPGNPENVGFTLDWLTKQIKSPTRVVDHTTNKLSMLNKIPEGNKGRGIILENLIDAAKAGGFAKPRP